MSQTNVGVLGPGSQGKRSKVPKGYCTFLQGFLLILLTTAISIGGWYAAGVYFFWSDLDEQRIEDQIVFLQQKIKAQPKDKELKVGLGYSYFLKGDNEAAIKEFNQVIEMDKNYYNAYYNLGLVYTDEERLDDAMELFQKCVEISPREFKSYVQLGIVYRKLKMYTEASENLEKANKLLPRNADIIYQIGLLAEEQGDKKAAVKIFKEALSYDPLFSDAQKALKRVQ